MGGRWTTCGIQCSCFPLLILVLAYGCSSLNLEGLALLDFQARVSHDPYGAFVSWDAEHGNPCSWSHVHCVFGHVQALDLKGLSLEGVLAPELGNLTHLRRLVLSDNHFSGVLPKELGELNRLEVLDLRDNNLIGNIPPEIGRMQSLIFLLLYNNNLEGTIPPELQSLNLLYKLQFDDNFTFGVLDAIGNLNRKLGRCIWQGGSNHLWNTDSFLSPFKETVSNYLKPLQPFSKGIFDNSCVNEEIQNVHIDGRIITSRKLAEEPANLATASSSRDKSARDDTKALPSSRNSGSFPAVRRVTIKFLDSPNGSPTSETESNSDLLKIMIGVCCGAILLITAMALFLYRRFPAVKTMGPWRPGLSKQLQKAFVTGIPKLDREELKTACEDFSNIIETMKGCTLYKGTLSNGVEICVASTTITALKNWSKHAEKVFHNKIDMLSRVNHKNFVNLIGYCEEDKPFARMMVFEYAPNGLLSERLHVQMLEHLDWSSRMRILMGVAYCLRCLHELSPPVVHLHPNSKTIYLTDDNAAKIGDTSFWREFDTKARRSGRKKSLHRLPADKETNIYSFGVFLLEIISGKHPYSDKQEHSYSDKQEPLVTWAKDFLNDKQNISHVIDPSLKSFKQNELEAVCKIIQDCIQKDPSKRPKINEIVPKLREVLGISPEQATPRLSPLWWAELELLSGESS